MKEISEADFRYFAKSEAFAKGPESEADFRYFAKSEAFAKGPESEADFQLLRKKLGESKEHYIYMGG